MKHSQLGEEVGNISAITEQQFEGMAIKLANMEVFHLSLEALRNIQQLAMATKEGLDLGVNLKLLKAKFLVIYPCKDVVIHLLDFQKSY